MTEVTARSYSPRILRGRRHFEGPFQTVPLSHLSFQEICHKSDECPLIRAMGHCKNGWRARCARRGVCCTARNNRNIPITNPLVNLGHNHLELHKEWWSRNPGVPPWTASGLCLWKDDDIKKSHYSSGLKRSLSIIDKGIYSSQMPKKVFL